MWILITNGCCRCRLQITVLEGQLELNMPQVNVTDDNVSVAKSGAHRSAVWEKVRIRKCEDFILSSSNFC